MWRECRDTRREEGHPEREETPGERTNTWREGDLERGRPGERHLERHHLQRDTWRDTYASQPGKAGMFLCVSVCCRCRVVCEAVQCVAVETEAF